MSQEDKVQENTERTVVLIKPEAFKRKLDREISRILRNEGLIEIQHKYHYPHAGRELVEKHLEHFRGEPGFRQLVKCLTAGPLYSLLIEAPDAVTRTWNLIHRESDQLDSEIRSYPGIIEAELLYSSSPESAERELKLWFGDHRANGSTTAN